MRGRADGRADGREGGQAGGWAGGWVGGSGGRVGEVIRLLACLLGGGGQPLLTVECNSLLQPATDLNRDELAITRYQAIQPATASYQALQPLQSATDLNCDELAITRYQALQPVTASY